MRWLIRFVLAVLVTAAGVYWLAAWRGQLPGRYDLLAPLDLGDPPTLVTSFKLWRMAGDFGSCQDALKRAGATFKPVPPRQENLAKGCSLSDTISVSRLSRASITPEDMRCDIALRLYLHERHDIQPLAQRYFGSGVRQIHHFGSYSCRNIRGSGRLSQHATANAFDLAGYRLEDGREISLKKGWKAGGAQSAFLRDLRVRACLLFNLVLSPDFNADHEDHFHFDMGRYMACN